MAVGTNEKILLNYLHSIEYNNDAANSIGANTSLTLRTAETAAAGTTNYVRKFGTPVSVTACSAISDLPAGQTMEVYALDGTLLGSKTAAGAFTAGGTVTAQGVYIELSGAATVVTSPESITLTGLGVHPLVMATETLGASALRLYVSETTSTYYDSAMQFGGARHVPVAGDEDLPYFTITSAYAALAARTIVHVLDSATYDEDLTSTGQSLDTASTFLQAALGQIATITRGAGARASREQVNQGDNTDTAYVSKTLSLGGVGTYQDPYTTIAAAIAGIGARTNIHFMDSETYTGEHQFNAPVTVEPLYGETPSIIGRTIPDDIACNIYGLTMSHTADVLVVGVDDYAGIISDNTVSGGANGIKSEIFNCDGATISRNVIFGNSFSGIWTEDLDTDIIIDSNIIYNNGTGIYNKIREIASTYTNVITNNVIYDNTNYGIFYEVFESRVMTLNGEITNNTIYNNGVYGIYFYAIDPGANLTLNLTISNMIVWGNGTFDLFKDTTATPAITKSNYGTNTGWTAGATNITTDPEFCKTTFPYKLGISADSGAYRTDTNSADMGANLNIIEINESDVTVNGFIIDGQSVYNSAVLIADVADHTGAIIIYNTIDNFQGIGVDPYDDGTDTDAIIKNNIIRNCGNGIKLSYGGNTVEENLIYNNSVYGVWSDYTLQSFIHNVFQGNSTGLYLESNSAGITIKDSIFSGNSNKDIDSEAAAITTYCCIEGAVSSNVDTTSDTNKLVDPLFVDPSNDDYNLKVIEGGYLIDSKCREAASDGKDIGAWDMSRSIESESWRKYQLAWNPRKLDPEYNGKGVSKFENALGFTKMFEKGHLRVLPLQWSRTQASTEELWKKIQYLSSLVPDRDQGRTEDQCRIRFNPLPSQLIISGTAATIDAATKTILDTDLDLTEDELKGYWASVKYLAGAGAGSEVFYAGMEADLSEWDSIVDTGAGSTLRATPGLDGTVGKLQITFAGNAGDTYYGDTGTNLSVAQDSIVVSFKINVDNLVMDAAASEICEVLYVNGSNFVLFSNLQSTVAGVIKIRLRYKNDAGATSALSYVDIDGGGDILITAIMKKSSAPGANNGSLAFYIDGELQETATGIDNDILFPTIDRVRFGAVANVAVGTTGTLDLDEFYMVEGDKMLIDKTNKIGIVPSAAWTTDEHAGRYEHLNGYYFLAKSNTANVVLFSDPNSVLIDEVIDWAFEKYFKMIKTEDDVLHLEDDDGELPTGSFDYYVDFIEMHVVKPNFKTIEERFYWLQETWKTGFSLFLEEL